MTEKEIIRHDIKCLRVATKIMCFNGRKEDVFKMLGYLKNPLAWKRVCDIIELRYNDGSHYTKDEHGRFTGSTSSGSGSSSSSGSGSAKPNESYSDSSSEFLPITQSAIDNVPKIDVFDDEKMNIAVHNACKEIVTDLKNDTVGTEEGISLSIDLQTKRKSKGKQGEGGVDITKLKTPYVSIHNHPSGETISGRDIRKFVADGYAESMCVVGNNGKIYVLQKTQTFNWVQFGIKTYDIDKKDNYNELVLKGAEKYGLQYYQK